MIARKRICKGLDISVEDLFIDRPDKIVGIVVKTK